MSNPTPTPTSVLSNGNVLMSNGNTVSGALIGQSASVSNNTSNPIQTLPNGNTLMTNGNTVGSQSNQTSNTAVPVAVVDQHVVLSNGDTVSPQHVSTLPQQASTVSHSFTPPMSVMSASSTVKDSSSECSVQAHYPEKQYCKPAPFASLFPGQKYFPINLAYGSSK